MRFEDLIDKRLTIAALISCLTFIIYYLYRSLYFPIHDFSNSYFGAHFFLTGKFTTDVFDPYIFNRMIADEGHKNIFASYSPNPPFASIFFSSVAWLPVGISKIVFNIISVILFLSSLIRLSHLMKLPAYLSWLVPFLFLIPVRNQILFGQTYFIIFFLLAEGYIAYHENKIALSAWWWSLAIALKVFPAILILFLIVKKDWKAMAHLSIACFILIFGSILLQGIEVWKIYFFEILPRSSAGEIGAAYTTHYQSALFLFKYWFVADQLSNPSPLWNEPILFHLSLILFKSIILALCVSVIRTGKDFFSYGFTLAGGMLITPYGSSYGNIILIFFFLSLIINCSRRVIIATVVLLFIAVNISGQLHPEAPIVFQFPRLLILITLFLIAFFITQSKLKIKFLVAFLILFSVADVHYLNDEKDKSHYLLTDDKHLLIFDYGLKNSLLCYKFWDDSGGQEIQTSLKVESLSFENVSIKNGQVWLNNSQITSSPDRKIKPAILNGNRITYLSDKGRGVGFYTLRVLAMDR